MKIASSTPIARYAEKKERNPEVAVFDYFAEKNAPPEHGNQVEEIIRRTSGLPDQKIQNFQTSYERSTTPEDVFEASEGEFKDVLRSYTVETLTGFYGATKQNLETILSNEKNNIRVINQSQSQAPVRVARPFVKKILEDDAFRVKMKNVLELPEKAHKDTVAEAFISEVQSVFENSRYVATARNEYLEVAKKAHDAGIAHVVTAGNLGRLTTYYESLGINAAPGAYKSVIANDYTTVLGATASQGTTTTRDDKAATFTSAYAGAEFAMHGVNVEVIDQDPETEKFGNGTSFSAPQATSLIHEMFKTNPKMTVPEMENILYKSTIPVRGSQEQVGAGQVDPERAMYLAEQSRFVSGSNFEALANATQAVIAV